jgi:CHAT domain-containing protein
VGRNSGKILIILLFASLITVNAEANNISSFEAPNSIKDTYPQYVLQGTEDSLNIYLPELVRLLNNSKYKEALPLAEKLEHLLMSSKLDPSEKVYPYLKVGTTYLVNQIPDEAEKCYRETLDLLKSHPVDSLYDKVYYNLANIYTYRGDFINAQLYYNMSYDYITKIYRKNDPRLAMELLALSIINLNLRDYEKGLQLADQGLAIVRAKPDSIPDEVIALLYQTKGTALSNLFDYHQSILNYKKAISYYDDGLPKETSYYVNMLSNIITAYYFLGNFEDCSYYFSKGEKIFASMNTIEMFLLYFNYSSILAENNMKKEGIDLLTMALNRIKKSYAPATREYNLVLQKYARFMLDYKIDLPKALELFSNGYKYLRDNPRDIMLRYEIALGYAEATAESGNYGVALDSVRSILYRENGLPVPNYLYANPADSLLKPGKVSFDILYTKYRILRMLYLREGDPEVLKTSILTAERMIGVLEKIRLNIGEEQSRLLLGNKYRSAYINVIQSLSDYFNISHDISFLEKAFEYSEKSKAASLLASIREMKALEGAIPEKLAGMVHTVEKRIGLFTTLSDEELNSEYPDAARLRLWNEIILSATNTRDSLKKEFAKNYPEYYSRKYDTRVVNISDIQKLTGKKKNYLSYVVSDSTLYIMVVNSRYAHIETVRIDSSFRNTILRYRRLLSSPDRNGNVSYEFRMFQSDGYALYKFLIEPVRPFLISDELIISPDNTLAYFPFETMVTSGKIADDLQYRSLPYLLKEFRISYAYSATLLAESPETKPTFRNRLVAFAPSYRRPVDINTLWINRQATDGTLPVLKYAPEEASFVARIASGKLFRDTSATKNRFTATAGSFDILHLAMHTVINNNDPANSGMIFSDSDSLFDNILRPYEIYAIRLNSKMVVLSSCFTGAGTLFAGEGVLSLARGFIFAGSRSVVMSLWEVDDRSGTDIIKSFYRNLRSGKSKSESLRRARIDYLRNADMLHSHPYFWSTMVTYGDDSPVYISWITRILFLLIPIFLGLFVLNYFRRR